MRITAGVFNWPDKFDKAIDTEEKIQRHAKVERTVVINSDVGMSYDGWVDVGDRCYGGQFAAMLDYWIPGTALFLIQADTKARWSYIIDRALPMVELGHGIVAPNCTNTFWGRKFIYGWNGEDFARVLHTDCTAWFIHPEVVAVLRHYKDAINQTELGWGVDLIALAISRLQGRFAMRDYGVLVQHDKGTGYNTDEAHRQHRQLLTKLDRPLVAEMRAIQKEKKRMLDQ